MFFYLFLMKNTHSFAILIIMSKNNYEQLNKENFYSSDSTFLADVHTFVFCGHSRCICYKKKWYCCVRERGVLRNVLTLPAKRDVDLFQLREVLTLPVKIVIDLVSKEEC